MAAPIRKVAPNSFITGPLGKAVGKAEAALTAADSPGIHASIAAFGAVVSSAAPQSLHRASVARGQIRRVIALK